MGCKTINMGMNTEPAWIKADQIIERFRNADDEDMIKYWGAYKARSIALRNQIIQAIDEDGQCMLSWECEGRTRHEMHARQWAAAMPQYEFIIDYNYYCLVKKREGDEND